MANVRTSEELASDFAAVARIAAGAGSQRRARTTLLDFGDEHLVVLSGWGDKLETAHALDLGATRIARDFFLHDPPTAGEIERAIDFAEDEIMRLAERADVDTTLWSASSALQAWAAVSGPMMTIETIEQWFQRLASASLGHPAAMRSLPTGREAAASLFVLREFMHHRGHASIGFLDPGNRLRRRQARRTNSVPSTVLEQRMATYKVGYFVGSLASNSINRLLAKALVRLAPTELVMSEIPIKDLPLYSSDYDVDYPPVARALKKAIADVDGVLFVTPEYNRSIPGGLKKAIDWASRPWGQNSFARKPSGVIGTSPGAIGTAVAQQSLRGVLCFCNSPLMNQVEAYIQFKPGLITADGEVTDDGTKQFLQNYMNELHTFIVRVLTVLPREA
jgi:chromate reductase